MKSLIKSIINGKLKIMLTNFNEQELAFLEEVKKKYDFDGYNLYFYEPVESIQTGIYWSGLQISSFLGDFIVKEFPFSDIRGEKYRMLLSDHEDPSWFSSDEANNLRQEIVELNETLPNDYGICDYPEQVIEKFPILLEMENRYAIFFTPIRKEDQTENGWRWHKWGEYIGNQEPTTEYLYDEPLIEEVLIYRIHELKQQD
jgi:hypothetical protein